MADRPPSLAGIILAVLVIGAGLAAWAWVSWEQFKFREDARRARWEDEGLED